MIIFLIRLEDILNDLEVQDDSSNDGEEGSENNQDREQSTLHLQDMHQSSMVEGQDVNGEKNEGIFDQASSQYLANMESRAELQSPLDQSREILASATYMESKDSAAMEQVESILEKNAEKGEKPDAESVDEERENSEVFSRRENSTITAKPQAISRQNTLQSLSAVDKSRKISMIRRKSSIMIASAMKEESMMIRIKQFNFKIDQVSMFFFSFPLSICILPVWASKFPCD